MRQRIQHLQAEAVVGAFVRCVDQQLEEVYTVLREEGHVYTKKVHIYIHVRVSVFVSG